MNQNAIDHQNIKQYNFGTPYDLSTITLTSTAIILDDNNPFGMVFSKDGKRLFQTFADTGVVEQYSLNNPFDGTIGSNATSQSASSTTGAELENPMSLYNFKLVGIMNGEYESYVSLINATGEVVTLQINEELSPGIKLVLSLIHI